MAVKTVLVPFVDKTSARLAFSAAVGVAKAENSHIIALYMRQRPMQPGVVYFPLGGVFPPEGDSLFKQQEDEDAAALRQLFDDLCKEFSVASEPLEDHKDDMGATASWREEKGELPGAFAEKAAPFDMTVIASPAAQDDYFQARLVEDLLFRSGRPLLLAPEAIAAKAPSRVVIAWNGGPEAASAAAASLPLLKAARDVKIITVQHQHGPNISADDLLANLRLHGVKASAADIVCEAGQAADAVLTSEVERAKPDLVVMGAYSHSRWREAVLGGFTRRMIFNSAHAVLLKR